MLSDLGKRDLFSERRHTEPIRRSEGEGETFNATIGIALEKGKPMHLKVIQETLSAYDPKDLYEYAPPAGKPELRKAWREKMLKENPSLRGQIVRQCRS